MASLQLSNSDLVKIRSSWADVMALNHYKDEDVVNKMFSNLISTNKDMKAVFRNPAVYGEQKELFTELLKFTMMYLHNVDVLNECMDEFIKENPSLVKVGVEYLEPMGGVLILTMRQILGKQKFHAGLETLWIKVYIYIANCILQNDESDVDSVMSESKDVSSEEEPVEPLNCAFALPAPAFKAQAAAGENTIKINLGGNAKYKGFRRSVTEEDKTQVSVKVPEKFIASALPMPSPTSTFRGSPSQTTLSDASLEVSFDPRPLRRNPGASEEPILTPRLSRRNSLVHEFEDLKVKDNAQAKLFDPRRKTNHRRVHSDMSANMEVPDRQVSGSSCESPVSDVEDQYQLEDDQIDFTQPVKSRGSVFDYNSFGIKGLDPIAESENDDKSEYSYDNGLLNYGASVEKGSMDELSSRTSSLSLHNLDYKLSISSGAGQSPTLDKGSPRTAHSEMVNHALANPYSTKQFSCLVPSLCSRSSSGQRASMGFMRSSFVLKKEMNELGYNHPENVLLLRQGSVVNVPTSRSAMSLPMQSPKNQFSQVFEPVAAQPVEKKAEVKRTPSKALLEKEKKKGGFRKMLGSIFGSSSPPPSRKVSGPISAPTTAPTPTPQAVASTQRTLRPKNLPQVPQASKSSAPRMSSALVRSHKPSVVESYSTSHRVSSLDIRTTKSPMEPAGYATLVYLRPLSDTASVPGSGESGHKSFFKPLQVKHSAVAERNTKKTNKYLVKKVPYKTIYIKDIIR